MFSSPLWILAFHALALQTTAQEECIASLRQYERECRDFQVSYVSSSASDPSMLADGSISSRHDLLCSRNQAHDQPLVVQVWRPDAGFRVAKLDNQWIAVGLRPGEKQPMIGAMHVLDDGLWIGQVRIADILEGRDDSNQYILKEFQVDEKDSTLWNLVVGRPNSVREWHLTLDSKKHWLCTRLTTFNEGKFVQTRCEYENRLRSLPFRSKLIEEVDGQIIRETVFSLTSSKAPSDDIFRLTHYGLSESLLGEKRRLKLSVSTISWLFVLTGLSLVIAALLIRRKAF